MQYHEFLRLTEANTNDCPYSLYAKYIEPAYMNNDDLFPMKEDVADYWREYGAIGFLPDMLARLRQAITAVRACCYYPSGLRQSGTDGLEEWIVKAARRVR